MDPRSNSTSGLGLPQSGNDTGQLPSIHAPQSFHAPDTPASHFDAPAPVEQNTSPQMGAMPISGAVPMQPQSMAIGQSNITATPSVDPPTAQSPQTTEQQLAQYSAEATSSFQAGPEDDTDTAFDEEWVNKARAAVLQTQADPYLQSQLLGKVKAQYIKLRYNKDIKVSEE